MPFSSLPEELFIEIIRGTFYQLDPLYWAPLQKARLVCKRWKETIEGTLSLWTFISTHMKRTRIQESLHFSGSHDLTVSAFMAQEEFWELVIPSASRWARVEIHGLQHEGSMERVRSTSLPRLTSLTLACCKDRVAGAFCGKLLRLEHLELHGVASPWSPTNFPSASLRSLRLIEHPLRSSRDTFQTFEILRSCAELITFHLDVPRTTPLPAQPPLPISLPRLKELLLQGMKNDLLRLILQTLHIPNCRSVTIKGENHLLEMGFAAVGRAVQSNGWGQIRESGRIGASMKGILFVDCGLVNEQAVEPVHLQLDFRGMSSSDSVTLDCLEAFARECRGCIGPNVGWTVRVLDVAWPSWLARFLSSCARLFPTTHTLHLMNKRLPMPTNTESNIPDPLECLHWNSSPNGEGDRSDYVGLAFPRLQRLCIVYHETLAEGIIRVAHERILNAGGNGMPNPDLQMEIAILYHVTVREDVMALSELTPQVTITGWSGRMKGSRAG